MLWPHWHRDLALVRFYTQPSHCSIPLRMSFCFVFLRYFLISASQQLTSREFILNTWSSRLVGITFFKIIKKNTTHAWTTQMAKLAISMGNVQETHFSIILTAEALKISKFALPRSTGIKKEILSNEHGDHIFKICNTPNARMSILTNVLCKNWCPNATFEILSIAIFH